MPNSEPIFNFKIKVQPKKLYMGRYADYSWVEKEIRALFTEYTVAVYCERETCDLELLELEDVS